MKLSQMRHFAAVCRHGSVTRAAAAMHISQPSVSSSVKELESQFGIELFHRVGKKLSLTKEGEFFLEKVTPILSQADLLEEQMRDLGNRKNHIRLGVPPMIGTFLFPPLFDSFRQQHPEIQLEILEYGSLQTRELVESDQLEVAIAIVDDTARQELHVQPILSTQLLYCVGPDHALAGRESVDLREIAQEPIILFKTDSYQHAVVQERFAQLGLTPNVLLYSSQLYTIKKFVAAGKAGAFLFREIAEMEPDLTGVPLAEPIGLDIALIWKKHRYLYSDVSRLIRFVKSSDFSSLGA